MDLLENPLIFILFLHLSLCDCQLLFLSKITLDVIIDFLGNVNNGPGTVN